MTFIFEVLSTYIITLILAKSSLFYTVRLYIRTAFPKLQIQDYPHFIECRLCVSFWASILICLIYNDWHNILPVYGASYFLATQERG